MTSEERITIGEHRMSDEKERQMADTNMANASIWRAGPGLDEIAIHVSQPSKSLEILEKLGPSPFERGAFPLIGFLATTYEKVTRIAFSGGDRELDVGERAEAPQKPADLT
jgi:hypothetical protein